MYGEVMKKYILYIDKEYLKKIYKRKSNNTDLNQHFELRIASDSPKKCDMCGKTTPLDGKMFHSLIVYTGLIFYFCCLTCLGKWLEREIKERELKSKGLIFFDTKT